MTTLTFDQTRKNELSYYGESVRLANELRAKPSRFYIDDEGNRIDIPGKQGFDIEDADFMTIVNWLADTRNEKSESLIAFVHRCLSVRFPTEYAQYKDNIINRYKMEYEMIQSNSRNEIEWLGEVGFQNKIRLDNSLNINNVKIIKDRNENIRIVRK